MLMTMIYTYIYILLYIVSQVIATEYVVKPNSFHKIFIKIINRNLKYLIKK